MITGLQPGYIYGIMIYGNAFGNHQLSILKINHLNKLEILDLHIN